MRKLSEKAEHTVDELAQRHGFSRAAVLNMFDALSRGNGRMAQFDHPEFGGSGQWMGGMTMVSDMFNDTLRARVSALAEDLAALAVSEPPSGAAPAASLFVPPGTGDVWWPSDLGTPASRGAQNGVRYAYFERPHRLAIEIDGRVTIYDTLDHVIGGFSQQQSRGGSLSFHSQHGLIDLATLPVVS